MQIQCDPPTSASYMLGSQVRATTPGLLFSCLKVGGEGDVHMCTCSGPWAQACGGQRSTVAAVCCWTVIHLVCWGRLSRCLAVRQESEAICFGPPSAGTISVNRHAWLLWGCSGSWTQVLTLALETLYQLSYFPQDVFVTMCNSVGWPWTQSNAPAIVSWVSWVLELQTWASTSCFGVTFFFCL